MHTSEEPTYVKTVLDSIKFNLRGKVGSYALDTMGMSLEQSMEEMSDSFQYHIFFKLLGQKKVHSFTVSTEVPATWWDHFKLAYIPKWIPGCSPPKYTTVNQDIEINVQALFPDLNVPSEHGRVVFNSEVVSGRVTKNQ